LLAQARLSPRQPAVSSHGACPHPHFDPSARDGRSDALAQWSLQYRWPVGTVHLQMGCAQRAWRVLWLTVSFMESSGRPGR